MIERGICCPPPHTLHLAHPRLLLLWRGRWWGGHGVENQALRLHPLAPGCLQVGIRAVVRLNKKVYERWRFTAHGFAFHDLNFGDGRCARVLWPVQCPSLS
jgi:hypothetical protein